MNKKRLSNTIQELIFIAGEQGLNISKEIIFSEACSFERGTLAGESKFQTPTKTSHFGYPASSGVKAGEIKGAGKPKVYFNITPRKLEEWKTIPPSPKTIDKLKSLGYSDKDIVHIKTQYEAHLAISNLEKENI